MASNRIFLGHSPIHQAPLQMLALAAPLLLVGFVWGVTNVLMKRGSAGINELPRKDSQIASLIQDFTFLLTRPLYVASFLGNLCGSILFYYTLSHAEVSLVGPLTNAVTFIFTTAAGSAIEKERISFGSACGMALVVIGVFICVQSKHV